MSSTLWVALPGGSVYNLRLLEEESLYFKQLRLAEKGGTDALWEDIEKNF